MASSDQGISSPWGAPVSFDIVSPTITVDFDQSVDETLPGHTVIFTGTTDLYAAVSDNDTLAVTAKVDAGLEVSHV